MWNYLLIGFLVAFCYEYVASILHAITETIHALLSVIISWCGKRISENEGDDEAPRAITKPIGFQSIKAEEEVEEFEELE